MCKAKNHVSGGKRCSFHLTQGVMTGMVAYVAAVTGLSSGETKSAFEGLKREGAALPDPSREEVDAFLEGQEFRIRHEPNLSEAKRLSILGRIRAAIGNVIPDGATFHAWKNVVAESWTRVRKKAAVFALIGAISAGVVGCSNSNPDYTDSAPVKDGPVVTAPVGHENAGPSQAVQVQPTSFTGPAVAKYGQDNVQAAYRTAADVAGEDSFNSSVVRPGQYQVSDFDFAKGNMTVSQQAEWDKTVKSALAGDVTAQQNVNAYAYYNVKGDGFTFRTDGAPVTNRSVSAPRTSVAANGSLVMTVTSKGDFRMVQEGKNVLLTQTKEATYFMVKDASGAWKVDGYTATFQTANPVADAT